MVDFVIHLYLAGHDSFTSSQKWLKGVTGTLFCPHCHNVYESVTQIDAVVANKKRRTDMDLIAVNCHRVELFSTRFMDVVGINLVKKTAGIGRLMDATGFEHERYRTIISRADSVLIRGSKESNIGLCRECGRLLYWPIGKRYVVRSELPNDPFFVSDGQTFCTPQFYEERISPAKLYRVASRKIRIQDESSDGLPSTTKELKAHLRASNKFK